MDARNLLHVFLSWFRRRHDAPGSGKGAARHPGAQTKEFLRYRLESLDKMLSDPHIHPEDRAILEKMRTNIELELGAE